MLARLIAPLFWLCALIPSVGTSGTTFTPPPGPSASPAQIAAVLAAVPPPRADERVIDFEKAEVGEPQPQWEDQGVVFSLSGPLRHSPSAKARVTFFPHLGTGHKGILNAMASDQAVPLKISFPGAGASSVTLVLWGSTGCPVLVEAYDSQGKLLDHKAVEAVPARKEPGEPVPFIVLTLEGPAIACVTMSGPRDGEFLAADEVRFRPVATLNHSP